MARSTLLATLLLIATGVAVQADTKKEATPAAPAAHDDQQGHTMVTPDTIAWGPAPASLPAGAQAAVIDGNPSKPGLFIMRLRFPANYKIPAHWHPADEHATVLSGTLYMGLGDKFDEKLAQALPVGGVGIMKAGTRHFAFTKEATEIQLHGVGPWGITYVNPKDDPRPKAAKN